MMQKTLEFLKPDQAIAGFSEFSCNAIKATCTFTVAAVAFSLSLSLSAFQAGAGSSTDTEPSGRVGGSAAAGIEYPSSFPTPVNGRAPANSRSLPPVLTADPSSPASVSTVPEALDSEPHRIALKEVARNPSHARALLFEDGNAAVINNELAQVRLDHFDRYFDSVPLMGSEWGDMGFYVPAVTLGAIARDYEKRGSIFAVEVHAGFLKKKPESRYDVMSMGVIAFASIEDWKVEKAIARIKTSPFNFPFENPAGGGMNEANAVIASDGQLLTMPGSEVDSAGGDLTVYRFTVETSKNFTKSIVEAYQNGLDGLFIECVYDGTRAIQLNGEIEDIPMPYVGLYYTADYEGSTGNNPDAISAPVAPFVPYIRTLNEDGTVSRELGELYPDQPDDAMYSFRIVMLGRDKLKSGGSGTLDYDTSGYPHGRVSVTASDLISDGNTSRSAQKSRYEIPTDAGSAVFIFEPQNDIMFFNSFKNTEKESDSNNE